jgi:hypothetical protein
MLRFLDSLEAPMGAMTLVVAAGAPPPQAVMERLTTLPDESRDVAQRLLERSSTGAALFWSPETCHVVVPPFPLRDGVESPGWRTGPLREMLTARLKLGVVLVRLSGYATGVFDGDTLVASKVGTAHVHGRHKAGGWSQQRFARRREKQARELYDRVSEAVTERFAPYERELDYVLLGGERFTLQGFVARCSFLQRLGPRVLERTLPVDHPNQAAFEGALEEAWVSRVLTFVPDVTTS